LLSWLKDVKIGLNIFQGKYVRKKGGNDINMKNKIKKRERKNFWLGVGLLSSGIWIALFSDTSTSGAIVIGLVGLVFIGASKYRLLK